MLSLKQGLPGALFLVLGLCLFFGTAGAAGAFSVDVKNLHYSDDSGRSIMYDYSAGSVGSVPPNAILLNGSAQITPGSGESGNSYFWGQAPGLPAATVTLGAGKATVSPVNAATGGVVVLFSEPPVPAATGPAAWFYALNLSNFNVDMTTPKVYEFDIGLGRDESAGPYNNATIHIIWVKGTYNGNVYPDATLIIQARIKNGDTDLWASAPVVRTGLDPAATTLMLDLSVQNGNYFFAAVGINDEGMTNLGEYTLTAGQGSFQRMPDLLPFIYMEEKMPESPFQVSSQHWNDAQGNFYNAWPRVMDPGQQLYSSVTLNSPGYLAETPLEYNSGGGYWSLSGTLFADDFNDNAVDAEKWPSVTTSVTESEGTFNVAQTTSTGGSARSRFVIINPYAPIVVRHKVKANYGTNAFFRGLFALNFRNTSNPAETPTMSVSVSHMYYQGTSGFYLDRNAANYMTSPPEVKADAIWDTWFNEEVAYNPLTGTAELWINGERKATANIGTLPSTAKYMVIDLDSFSWDVAGPYYYLDDLAVSQPWTGGNVFLSANTPPAEPVVFNFTATKKAGGTETASKTISGYVTSFATPLSPTGSVNTTPTFSWNAVPGATSYSVQVSDANGNRIWNQYAIPPSTTSVVYNSDGKGPALVNGQTYRYDIVTSIFTNGMDNESFATGSFTYTGSASQTISFSGWVKTAPNWPATDNMTAAAGAVVKAYLAGTTPTQVGTTAAVDVSTGAFTVTGIPANTTFYLVAEPPTGYLPAVSKLMMGAANIQAYLPFVLFSPTQYSTTLGNTAGTGIIIGRVAMKNSPTSFQAGATVEARTWTPGTPPVLGDPLPVTYSGGGSATASDGIYMVKNVPSGTLVQLVATLTGHTFEFNGAIVPAQGGQVSEESFFATPGSAVQVMVYPNEAMFLTATGNTTLIDFQDRNTSAGRAAFAGNEYAGQGITFSSPNSQPLWVYPPPVSFWTWPSNYLSPGNAPFEGGDSNGDSLTLTFSPAVAAVGWTFLDMPNPNAVTIRLYDVSNNLIHETANGAGISVAQDNSAFWGVVSPVPIARVEIIDTADNGDDIAYDNFRFAVTATPVVQTPFNAYSYHQDTSYFINLFVDDPTRAFTGVTVNGPGLDGNVGLSYIEARKRWEIAASIPLGSTLPTGPRTYNFTATPAIGTPVTGSKTVSVYVEGIATNLLPAGNIATVPTFSWTGVAGATGYAVVLDDLTAQSSGVWFSPQLTPEQTSILYNGDALVAGHDYAYTVISQNNSDGNNNSSFARGQFTYTVAAAGNLIQNGGFGGNLNDWVVNPAVQTGTPPWTPLIGSGPWVSLHPQTYGFVGTILYQNLNLTNVAGKSFTVGMKLTRVSAPMDGETVAVWVTYVNATGGLQRIKVLHPANSTIETNTPVTGTFALPEGAQRLVKLELAKENDGEFHATDVTLWADGVTVNPLPQLTGLSATSGAYGTTLTLSGANFGSTPGSVKIGGVSANVVSWTDTRIDVALAAPVPSGPVLVNVGQVESNLSPVFYVTSPYYTMTLLNPSLKVIKGQAAEFLLRSDFFNGFTTAGINLGLQGGDASTLAGKATFLPVPVKGAGGTMLKIDTSSLGAGTYSTEIQANNGGQILPVGTFNLQVVTVSDIRFYEMDYSQTPAVKNYFTTKTVMKQGQFYANAEVIGSDGQIFAGDPGLVRLTEVPAAAPRLGIYDSMWGSDLYALWNGSTTLRATAPDGVYRDLGITVNYPTDSYISSIGLSGATGTSGIPPVYNNRSEALYWYAQGTTGLGWIGISTAGLMNFDNDFLDKLVRSQDGLSASSTFNLLNRPVDIGTAILSVATNDSNATAAIPLTTVNAPGTGLMAFGIRSLDPMAFAEMFQVSFFNTEGQLQFSRQVFAMHHMGYKPVLVGNIPPGTYKILFAPENPNVKPQWWPNAMDIAGAAPVTFTADQTTGDIYFFASPQPTGATLTLTPPVQNLTSTQAVTGSVSVTASTPDLAWSASSNADWITVTSGFSGLGNGVVQFAVAANTTADSRTGTIAIGDQTFTVIQPGTTSVLKGDLNGDGRIDLTDALLALEVLAGRSPTSIRANYATSGADVNGDNRIGHHELEYILQFVGGLRQ